MMLSFIYLFLINYYINFDNHKRSQLHQLKVSTCQERILMAIFNSHNNFNEENGLDIPTMIFTISLTTPQLFLYQYYQYYWIQDLMSIIGSISYLGILHYCSIAFPKLILIFLRAIFVMDMNFGLTYILETENYCFPMSPLSIYYF